MVDTIQVKYAELGEIQRIFTEHMDHVTGMMRRLQTHLDPLIGGEWTGANAQIFFDGMQDEVLPALQRLKTAFNEADNTTAEIIKIMRAAEEEAASYFKNGYDNNVGGANSANVASETIAFTYTEFGMGKPTTNSFYRPSPQFVNNTFDNTYQVPEDPPILTDEEWAEAQAAFGEVIESILMNPSSYVSGQYPFDWDASRLSQSNMAHMAAVGVLFSQMANDLPTVTTTDAFAFWVQYGHTRGYSMSDMYQIYTSYVGPDGQHFFYLDNPSDLLGHGLHIGYYDAVANGSDPYLNFLASAMITQEGLGTDSGLTAVTAEMLAIQYVHTSGRSTLPQARAAFAGIVYSVWPSYDGYTSDVVRQILQSDPTIFDPYITNASGIILGNVSIDDPIQFIDDVADKMDSTSEFYGNAAIVTAPLGPVGGGFGVASGTLSIGADWLRMIGSMAEGDVVGAETDAYATSGAASSFIGGEGVSYVATELLDTRLPGPVAEVIGEWIGNQAGGIIDQNLSPQGDL